MPATIPWLCASALHHTNSESRYQMAMIGRQPLSRVGVSRAAALTILFRLSSGLFPAEISQWWMVQRETKQILVITGQRDGTSGGSQDPPFPFSLGGSAV